MKIEIEVTEVRGGWKILTRDREGFTAKYEGVPIRVKELLQPDFPKSDPKGKKS